MVHDTPARKTDSSAREPEHLELANLARVNVLWRCTLSGVVITVTGSTGTIGSELIRLLSVAQAQTRAVFRDASKYFLTGGEAVGFADLAAALTDLMGRTVAYRPISMDEAQARMEAKGAPPDQVEATLAISAYQKSGGPTSIVSDKVARILGRPPRTLRDFAQDHADRFRGKTNIA